MKNFLVVVDQYGRIRGITEDQRTALILPDGWALQSLEERIGLVDGQYDIDGLPIF